MKPKPAARPLRRPPRTEGRALSLPGAKASRETAAGGPTTRRDTKLGRCLAELLAYFEVRTVTVQEIELIRPTHDNGWLRPQVEAKLASLHPQCPDHRKLRRLAVLSLDLLTAIDEGRFNPGPSWPEIEPRLLRALAYFVRENDAIPDHLPEGFDDDMREFESLAERAEELFGRFECFHGRT